MKIEILYNCVPRGQIQKQNDVRIELNTRLTYLQGVYNFVSFLRREGNNWVVMVEIIGFKNTL